MRMPRLGGGLTAMLGLLAAAGHYFRPRPVGPPILGTRNPWPEPNYRNTQNRTDHQHEGERARRRRQRGA